MSKQTINFVAKYQGFEGNYLATIPDAEYKITGYNFIKTIEEEDV